MKNGLLRFAPFLGALSIACATATGSNSSAVIPAGKTPWADSVLASLTLREKAAQLVWAFSLGDYVTDDSPAICVNDQAFVLITRCRRRLFEHEATVA